MNSTYRKTKAYQAKVKLLEKNFADLKAGQQMAIGTPELIKEIILEIPSGESLSFSGLRTKIAEVLNADVACPVTTAIYLRVAIEEEFAKAHSEQAKAIVPFWRAVEPSAKVFSKLEPQVQSYILSRRAQERLK